MDVFVPETLRQGKEHIFHEHQSRINPMIYNFISILIKQLKGLQNILHASGTFEQGKTEFLENAVVKKNCRSHVSNLIQLYEFDDPLCKRPHTDYASRNYSSICEVQRVKPDQMYNDLSLTSEHVFKLDGKCYENKKQLKQGVCTPFVPFMPASGTSFVQVLRKNCLYDVKIDGLFGWKWKEVEKNEKPIDMNGSNQVFSEHISIEKSINEIYSLSRPLKKINHDWSSSDVVVVTINGKERFFKPIKETCFTVIALQKDDGANKGDKILHVIKDISGEYQDFDKIKTRVVSELDLTTYKYDKGSGKTIEIDQVLQFRGPAIINEFVTLYKQGKKCKAKYAEDLIKREIPLTLHHYEPKYANNKTTEDISDIEDVLIPVVDFEYIGDPSLYADYKQISGENVIQNEKGNKFKFIRLDNREMISFQVYHNMSVAKENTNYQVTATSETYEIKCGLNAYILGRMGYKNITYRGDVPIITTKHNLYKTLKTYEQTRDESIPTSSTLYYKSLNPEYEPPKIDPALAEFGHTHEKDGLITLQKYLRSNPATQKYKVYHNKQFYKLPKKSPVTPVQFEEFGGTPDGFVLDGEGEDAQLVATVEVKSTKSNVLTEVPLQTEVQAKSHILLMNTILETATVTAGYVVQWNMNETRITKYDGGQQLSISPCQDCASSDWVTFILENYNTDRNKIVWNKNDTYSEPIPYRIPSVNRKEITDFKPLKTLNANLENVQQIQPFKKDELPIKFKLHNPIRNKSLIDLQHHTVNIYDVFYDESKENEYFRAKIPITFLTETENFIEVSDSTPQSNRVVLNKIPLSLLKSAIPQYVDWDSIDIFLDLMHTIPILQIEASQDRKKIIYKSDDITTNSIMLKSFPIPKDLQGFKPQGIHKDLVVIKNEETNTEFYMKLEKLNSQNTIEIGEYRCNKYYILKKQNDVIVDSMCIFHNLNPYDALRVHISKFDLHKCNSKYWARLIYILSALPENEVNLYIADKILKRGSNVSLEFWKAYHSYIEKGKIKHTMYDTPINNSKTNTRSGSIEVDDKDRKREQESMEKNILKALSLFYHTHIVLKSDILKKSLKIS